MPKWLTVGFLLVLVGGCAQYSEEELARGFGPVQELSLPDSIDTALAQEGARIFQERCSACHQLDERLVCPPLRQVLERRRPEFVMNMMLNPDEMIRRHPVVKKLIKEYLVPMPDQQLTETQARAILEFLRLAQQEKASASN